MKKGGPEFVKRAPEGLSLFKITPPKASSFFAPRGAMCRVEGKLLKGESFHNKRILAEATHPVTTRKAYVRHWEEKLKLKARHDICLNFTHFWGNKLVSFFN